MKVPGVQKTRGCEFSLPRLPPGLGSRGAEILSIELTPPWHLRGLDSKVIFKFRKCSTEIKKNCQALYRNRLKQNKAITFQEIRQIV